MMMMMMMMTMMIIDARTERDLDLRPHPTGEVCYGTWFTGAWYVS